MGCVGSVSFGLVEGLVGGPWVFWFVFWAGLVGCLLYLIFVVLLCELGFGWGYLAYTVVWAALLVWLSVRAGASGAWFGLALVGFWVWLLACRGFVAVV